MAFCISVLISMISPLQVLEIPPEVSRSASIACFLKAGEGGGTAIHLGQRSSVAWFLTSRHEIVGESSFEISWFDPFVIGENSSKDKTGTLAGGKVVSTDPSSDLALIQFDNLRYPIPNPKVPKLDQYIPPRVPVWSVGCEKGYPTIEGTKLLGKKLLKTADGNAFHWETEGGTVPGRSGGPLINAKGEWIGLCHGVQTEKGFTLITLKSGHFYKKTTFHGFSEPTNNQSVISTDFLAIAVAGVFPQGYSFNIS